MITTVTMNASLDKAYFMKEQIVNGTVMRLDSCRTSAGGKGVNVARVAALCGAKVKATGLTGGFNGQQLEALLDKDGIVHQFVHVSGETRCCINILDQKYGSTEYLEPGCEISDDEEQQFMQMYPDIIRDSDVVTISGSIPRGMKSDIYGRMITIAKAMGKEVILDSSGETLSQGIKSCPTVVKPNRDEIEQLFDIKIHSMQDVIRYAEKIRDIGIPYVVVSLGKEGALLVCEEGVFHGRPPEVEVVNTVGCGDSMVGALAVALERKYKVKESLKYAAAAATANAMSPNTGDFDPKDLENLLKQVTVEQI